MKKAPKIYTRFGDGGMTALANGETVSKHSLRIEVCGALDELNAWLGLIRTCLTAAQQDKTAEMLQEIQNQLFSAGAEIAAAGSSSASPSVEATATIQLEKWIDGLTEELAPLRNFILPGGSEINAQLHIARTVCRRAERRLVHLSKETELPQALLIYINRLSDFLFTLARYEARRSECPEYIWSAPKKPAN